MIYYQLDPIFNPNDNDLSDSTTQHFENFSLNSRITKIAHSTKPSEVVMYCSKYKNGENTNEKNNKKNDVDLENGITLNYNENDLIEIIHSLNVAEKNFLLEKELNEAVNFILMKTINPSKEFNTETSNLSRLQTDSFFKSMVKSQLKKYSPMHFHINGFISKHDIGVQSLKQPKAKKVQEKSVINQDVDDIIVPPIEKSKKKNQKKKNLFIKKKFKHSKNGKKKLIFLSESDTDNNGNEVRQYQSDETESVSNEVTQTQCNFKNIEISNEYNQYSYNSTNDNDYTDKKTNLSVKNHHQNHKKLLKTKDVNTFEKQKNSSHRNSELTQNGRLSVIKNESSNELKEKMTSSQSSSKLLTTENSLNMLVDKSSSMGNTSDSYHNSSHHKSIRNGKTSKKDKKKLKPNTQNDDFFEIDFEIEEEEEVNNQSSENFKMQNKSNQQKQRSKKEKSQKKLQRNKHESLPEHQKVNQKHSSSNHLNEYSSNYNVCSEYDNYFEHNEKPIDNKD